ncbi:MAG: hypothetical protein AB2548_19720, partial [Candidatus Thiodiazotropha sp.]
YLDMVEVVGSTPIAPTNENKGLDILAPLLKTSLADRCHGGVFLWTGFGNENPAIACDPE